MLDKLEEDTIDVEVNLGKPLADKINKMTKKELLGRLVVMILRNQVQDQTIETLEQNERQSKELKTAILAELKTAQDDIEQARSMIFTIMERWSSS